MKDVEKNERKHRQCFSMFTNKTKYDTIKQKQTKQKGEHYESLDR